MPFLVHVHAHASSLMPYSHSFHNRSLGHFVFSHISHTQLLIWNALPAARKEVSGINFLLLSYKLAKLHWSVIKNKAVECLKSWKTKGKMPTVKHYVIKFSWKQAVWAGASARGRVRGVRNLLCNYIMCRQIGHSFSQCWLTIRSHDSHSLKFNNLFLFVVFFISIVFFPLLRLPALSIMALRCWTNDHIHFFLFGLDFFTCFLCYSFFYVASHSLS